MLKYKSLFMSYMDSECVKYSDLDTENDNVVKVVYNGDNLNSIPIYVFFDTDDDPLVQFKCWNIANFKGKEDKAVRLCNNLNAKWRWVRFFVDSDSDIIADIDAVVDFGSCGAECLQLVRRIVNIVDESYPEIASALWS